jgi:hypothetical protein
MICATDPSLGWPGRAGAVSRALCGAALLLLAAVPVAGVGAKTAKKPHAPPLECAAIILPGLPDGTHDGRQQAGFYKSELGRLELHADVSGGEASHYTLSLPGQSLIPAARPLPRPVSACLKAKGVAGATHPLDDCRGERFKIIMTRAATAQYLLLYAMSKPGPWHLCRALTVAGGVPATP